MESKSKEPFISDNLDLRVSDINIRDDERETPLKQPVTESTQHVKSPAVENTMREKTQRFVSGDDCDTQPKGLYFPGSEDRSVYPQPYQNQPEQDAGPTSPPPAYTSLPNDQDAQFKNPRSVQPKAESSLQIDENIILPLRYSAGHYDVFIVNHPDDYHRAINIKRVLEKYCVPEGEERINVLVLGEDNDKISSNIQGRVAEIAEASDRTTLYFLLVTPAFCKNEFFRMVKDECLWLSCTDDSKKWSVIPVRSRNTKQREPFGLGALKGITLENDLVGELNYDDPELCIDGLSLKRKNVVQMIGERVHFRKEREIEQEKLKEKYIEEELHRRRLTAIEEQTQRIREQKRREAEREAAVERAERRAKEPLPPRTPSPPLQDQFLGARAKYGEQAAAGEGYQVHVIQNNYIGAPQPEVQYFEEEDIEYEIIRGDPPPDWSQNGAEAE